MTKEEIHSRLLAYFNNHMTDDEREIKATFYEKDVAGFIRAYLDGGYEDLTTHNNPDYYERMRSEVKKNEDASRENQSENNIYTAALRDIAMFFNSKAYKGKEEIRMTEAERVAKKVKSNSKSSDDTKSSTKTKVMTDPLLPTDNNELTEGKLHQVNVTKHERNPRLRQLCLAHYGYKCQVCGMDFEDSYGKIGRAFIEVHHLKPIASTDEEHVLDPEEGLIPLCSNCHSMIHRGATDGQPMTLEALRQVYQENAERRTHDR